MRLSAVAFLMILTTVFLSGCTQTTPVAVEDRSSQYYGRATSHPLTQEAQAEDKNVQVTLIKPAVEASAKPQTLAMGHWQWPVEGDLAQTFGRQKNGAMSMGITIVAAAGTPIHAAQSGKVVFVGNHIQDYGMMVILQHGDGSMTSYAHAESITVAKGDVVQAGDVIGTVGKSGNATSPQLHFALREGDRTVDPLSKLPQRVAAN